MIKVYSKIDSFSSIFDRMSKRIKNNLNIKKYSPLISNKVLSKYYSTSNFNSLPLCFAITKSNSLEPWFISCLTDAEGTFFCTIRKSPAHKLGWRVDLGFQLVLRGFALHKKDLDFLILIQEYFKGVGSIARN